MTVRERCTDADEMIYMGSKASKRGSPAFFFVGPASEIKDEWLCLDILNEWPHTFEIPGATLIVDLDTHGMPSYWSRNEYLGIKDEPITDIDEAQDLMAAVVGRAAMDYADALRGADPNPARTIGSCERFFREDIGRYSDLDGEQLMAQIKANIDKEEKMKEQKTPLLNAIDIMEQHSGDYIDVEFDETGVSICARHSADTTSKEREVLKHVSWEAIGDVLTLVEMLTRTKGRFNEIRTI